MSLRTSAELKGHPVRRELVNGGSGEANIKAEVSRDAPRTRLSLMLSVTVTGPITRLPCGERATPAATTRSTPRGRAGRCLRRLRARPRWVLLRGGKLGKVRRSPDETWRHPGWRVGGLRTIGRLSAASGHRRRRRRLPIGRMLGPARARWNHQAFLVSSTLTPSDGARASWWEDRRSGGADSPAGPTWLSSTTE